MVWYYLQVSSLTWSIPVSLFLISCGYWENYVNKFTALGPLGTKLRELKKKTRRMRIKIYIAVSLWKIVLSLALMTAITSDLKMQCLEVSNGFGYHKLNVKWLFHWSQIIPWLHYLVISVTDLFFKTIAIMTSNT